MKNNTFTIIIRTILGVGLLVYVGVCIRKERAENNPRAKQGKETIEWNDSTYYITFTIDSVKENAPEPDERYR